MNGMQYLQPSFTLPSGPQGIGQEQWDFSFLSDDEFQNKYGFDKIVYQANKKIRKDLGI